MFRADLHTHTNCSDGSMTPQELVAHAKQIGLSGLSITDHDTVAAYSTAIAAAEQAGLLLGIGAEFSSFFQQTSIHVLGYNFSLESPQIASLCQRHKHRRHIRNQRILAKLSRFGFCLDEELAAFTIDHPNQVIGRPHIAALMIQKGHVQSIKEAFDRYLGDGKPCFDSGDMISTEETIATIHQAGGKAFIAHPHLIKRSGLLRALFRLPFDGIECYYGRSQPKLEARFLKEARDRGWLISGGSDFHGESKSYLPLGCSWVDEEHFRNIFQS